jgi:2-polyprenyl-3-methyl-5-hydroxy-6-metoxy-1,4-benzoquinol methylase
MRTPIRPTRRSWRRRQARTSTRFAHARRRCSRASRKHLGDLRGKRVIEYGCGLGQLTVLLARSGAEVTAFDISSQSIDRPAGEQN